MKLKLQTAEHIRKKSIYNKKDKMSFSGTLEKCSKVERIIPLKFYCSIITGAESEREQRRIDQVLYDTRINVTAMKIYFEIKRKEEGTPIHMHSPLSFEKQLFCYYGLFKQFPH